MKASRGAAVLLVAVAAAALVLFVHFHGSLIGRAASQHSVTLHWSPSPGATSYNVYRGEESGGPYEKIATTTEPTYVDKQVASGAVLYYVVTALHGTSESRRSKEIKAEVP